MDIAFAWDIPDQPLPPGPVPRYAQMRINHVMLMQAGSAETKTARHHEAATTTFEDAAVAEVAAAVAVKVSAATAIIERMWMGGMGVTIGTSGITRGAT